MSGSKERGQAPFLTVLSNLEQSNSDMLFKLKQFNSATLAGQEGGLPPL
jgi:hypothetical protein